MGWGLARTAAAVFGVVYLLVGLVGFIIETPLFGLFPVSTLHNVVHIVLGAVLLYGAMSTSAAIMTTRVVGAILLVIGILGFFVAEPLGEGVLPIGGNDVWLHLASGVILLAVGFFMTSAEPSAA
jgi:preprotein translocase subunit Sss1